MKITNTINTVAIAVLIVLLTFQQCSNMKQAQTDESFIEALTDTLQQYRNRHGQQITSIKSLEAKRVKDLTKLNVADSTINWLQKVVSKQKGLIDAMVLQTTTTNTITEATTVIRTDTVVVDSIAYLYPVYSIDWIDEWSKGMAVVSNDSVRLWYELYNEFEVKHQRTKDGLLLTVKSLNPNTTTNRLQSFRVAEPKRRFNIGLQAGYGLGLQSGRFEPFVGFGIGFKLN